MRDLRINELETISEIESNLFDVIDLPTETPTAGTLGIQPNIKIEPNKGQSIYSSNGYFLGNTLDKYESLQPSKLFDVLIENLQQIDGLDLSKLKLNSFKNDKKIMFRQSLGLTSFRNDAGKTEDLETDISVSCGFGGYSSIEVGLFNYRFVCSNGMIVRNDIYSRKFKNTSNSQLKALHFLDALSEQVKASKEFNARMIQLDKTKIENAFIQKVSRSVLGIDKDGNIEDLSTRKKNQFDDLMSTIDLELSRCGKTGFGLLHGITNYTNHKASKTDSLEYIATATGEKINNKAQDLIYALV